MLAGWVLAAWPAGVDPACATHSCMPACLHAADREAGSVRFNLPEGGAVGGAGGIVGGSPGGSTGVCPALPLPDRLRMFLRGMHVWCCTDMHPPAPADAAPLSVPPAVQRHRRRRPPLPPPRPAARQRLLLLTGGGILSMQTRCLPCRRLPAASAGLLPPACIGWPAAVGCLPSTGCQPIAAAALCLRPAVAPVCSYQFRASRMPLTPLPACLPARVAPGAGAGCEERPRHQQVLSG